MSKFLEIVENNNPEVDLDSITEVKRELQRMLIKMGISAKASFTNNILYVTLPDKRVVELEVKNVKAAREEEAEDPTAVSSLVSSIVSSPDQKRPTSIAGQKFQTAKNNIANTAVEISDRLKQAAKQAAKIAY